MEEARATTISSAQDATPSIQQAQRDLDVGDAHFQQGDFEKARRAYKKAAVFLPNKANAKLQALPPAPTPLAPTPIIPTTWRDRFATIKRQLKTVMNRQRTLSNDPFFPKDKSLPPFPTKSDQVLASANEVSSTLSLIASLEAVRRKDKKPFRDLVQAIIHQFNVHSPSLEEIQELVLLGTIPDETSYIQILQKMVAALNLNHSHLLNVSGVAQGLAVLILHCPIDLSKQLGILTSILDVFRPRLEKTQRECNALELITLLRALSTLLDAMVRNGVSGLHRTQLQEPLKALLSKIVQQGDKPEAAEIRYQASYAKEALAHIMNDETSTMAAVRRTFYAGAGIAAVASATTGGVGRLGAVYTHFSEATNFSIPFGWYTALLYLDNLIESHHWKAFETFSRTSKFSSDVSFLQGLCLRLEHIAATQIGPDVQASAVNFLEQLNHSDSEQDKYVAILADVVLSRLRKLADPSDAHSYYLLPVWDPIWHLASSNTLLRTVQTRNQRHDNIDQIPLLAQHLETLVAISRCNASNVQSQPLAPLGEIDVLRVKYLEVLAEDEEIKGALALYVPPFCTDTAQSDAEPQYLNDTVNDFLAADQKVLLLLGEAGAGKSTFNHHLARRLWKAYQVDPANQPIPLFISLATLENPNRNLINEFLEENGFSNQQLQQLQKEKQPFIFILDGYDEIATRHSQFYTDNKLNRWNAKIIVSSRPEYLGSNYKMYFHPAGAPHLLQERWLAAFSDETISRYIQQYCEHHKTSWNFQAYAQVLNQIPELRELVRNPFLLKFALQVLPELNIHMQAITLTALYDRFMADWFERSQGRLAQIQLKPTEQEAFDRLAEEGFMQHGLRYSQELSLMLYQAQVVVATYSEETDTYSPLDCAQFLEDNMQTRLLRLSAPLIRQGDSY
jgi:hypothetical protein